MRHEQLKQQDSFDIIDIAANIADHPPQDGATSSVPDVPPAVGTALVAVYVGLILVFLATMGRGGQALFALAISGFYVAMFMGVPRIFLAIEKDSSKRPDLARFMAKGIDTYTGHMSGASALLQMFAVPVFLTLGILAMGLASLWIL